MSNNNNNNNIMPQYNTMWYYYCLIQWNRSNNESEYNDTINEIIQY